MNPILKNILAVIAGWIGGGALNMGLILLGSSMVGLPEGVNAMDPDSLANNIHLFEFKHFVFPFLAHALGTLLGAFIAAKIAANNNMKFALAIGVLFLLGGIANAFMIGGPMAFNVIDIVFAYIPMAWLGGRLAGY